MLGNYLTTALRFLWRERGYAAINIFGLAIGFALCLLSGALSFAIAGLTVGHQAMRAALTNPIETLRTE